MTTKQQLRAAGQAAATGATLAVILTPLFALGQVNGTVYIDTASATSGAILSFCAGFLASLCESLRAHNN